MKSEKIFNVIVLTLTVVGLGAILVSIFYEQQNHNFALVIGLGCTAIANLMIARKNMKKRIENKGLSEG